jgi:hypothetical protein
MANEIAAAAMTARMKLPDIEEKDKPKRRPIPDRIPRMEVELSPGADACADCGGRLRRIGEDVTEELEYVPGPSPLSSDQWRNMARHREPHCPTPADMFMLRTLRSGPTALAPDRTRPPWSRPAGPCSGQQICRPLAALPPEPDLRPRGPRSRPLNLGRPGRQIHHPAGTSGRCHRPPCSVGRGDLRR